MERLPEETARLLALSFLDEADAAADRMDNSEDTEALHDFRVGLRRLRSCMRAYRLHLRGAVSKKIRKRLKSLASSTSQARDTEVQIAWLEPQVKKLNDQQQIGHQWLVGSLKSRQIESQAPSLRKVTEEFRALKQDLAKKLSVYEYKLDPTHPSVRPTFLSVTGRLIRKHLAVLKNQLSAVHSVADDEKIHQARISGKRLRYLLEPLRREIASAKTLVKQFKNLQDLLGELHDSKVLEDEISAALERSAVERARNLQEVILQRETTPDLKNVDTWEERHGLLELLGLLRDRADRLFSRLETRFFGENGDIFLKEVDDLGRKLDSVGEGPRHRKYLLRHLPDIAKRAPSSLIDEGWLPGRPAREVLRRVRTGRSVTYYRVIFPEADTNRGTIEEKITRKYFDSLWPLTERRRLRRRSYEIADGIAKWHVDAFPDQGLILAEVELGMENADSTLPEWLLACMEREVTGRAKYEGVALARSSPTKTPAPKKPKPDLPT
jgi:CHAD domain-containing protein/CYTH domain-containing protein